MTPLSEAPLSSLTAPSRGLTPASAPVAPTHRGPVRPAGVEGAQPSSRTTAYTSPAARLGFWSALLAASASVAFLIASGPVLLGVVSPPWDNVLTLAPSLVLAPAFLVLLVCLHEAAPADKKLWGHLAVAFAGVYVALNCVVYTLALGVLEPLIVRGDAARAGLLTIDPGGVLNAIDGLGYTFLGLATLFAAPMFSGNRLNRWIRWLLIVNGVAIVPVLLTYFVDRAFLVLAAPLWTVPEAAILLAIFFRRTERSVRAEGPQ